MSTFPFASEMRYTLSSLSASLSFNEIPFNRSSVISSVLFASDEASDVTSVLLFLSANTAVAPIPVPTRAIVRTPATTRTIYLFFNLSFNSGSFIFTSSLYYPNYLFLFLNPILVAQITLSNIMNIEGNTSITTNILIIAPLARSIQIELIMSMFE